MKLITLTETERHEACVFHNDPDAWKMVEDKANRDVRKIMRELTWAIDVARAHPTDPDCEKFLAMLRSVCG